MKRALILDLDNTIYPVSSIADHLFEQLFALLDKEVGLDTTQLQKAKSELTRRPYQQVADEFNFGPELKAKGVALLNNITCEQPMQPYADYQHIRNIPLDKFLVTTGFTKLQLSKVKQLDIAQDFKEIHIVDPAISPKTKQIIFSELIEKYNYAVAEVLVIGDDPQSEIKSAAALRIDTFLYDPENKYPEASTTYRGTNFEEVLKLLK